MKTIKFTPLRLVKKTGKITVASYMQWRKVFTADYSKFNLVINNKHKVLNKTDYVYNHKGELLFFYNYNPADVPVFQYSKVFDLDPIKKSHVQCGILWEFENHVNYNMKGADCEGVPLFSHFTQKYVATHYNDVSEFEPLTVETVLKWYGWFLWQLNNVQLNLLI